MWSTVWPGMGGSNGTAGCNTLGLVELPYRTPRPFEVERSLSDVRLVRYDMCTGEPRGSQDVVPVVMGEHDRFDLHLLTLAEGGDVLDLVGKECRVDERGVPCVVQDTRDHGVSAALRRPEVRRQRFEPEAHVRRPSPEGST